MRINYSFLALLRNRGFSRWVAGVVIGAMLMPLYPPASVAAEPSAGPEDDVRGSEMAPGQALSRSVRKAKGLLEKAGRNLGRGESISAERQELADLRKAIATLDTDVRAQFENTGALLAKRGVPASILTRHDETYAFYREEVQTLLGELRSLETEADEAKVAAVIERVHERLTRQKHRVSQQPFDPGQLPHEAQRPATDNLPRTTREEFLGAGLLDTPLVQLVAGEEYRLEGLPDADDPAYLGESTEVRLSPEVQAKAAELDHDPVAIYHWVRNQVEWLPTWGAVQDADLTLSARRGNAMDIASLLISLLRVSGIPSRYVHGTIEVPEDVFRNWAGGFEHIEEAMNYAASGGIPLTGLLEGGRVTHVRMEHIWVEAAVDFLPSRGAVMREADTWLPLDPSFKQYAFLGAIDTPGLTGLDGSELIATLIETGNSHVEEGWVTQFDQSVWIDVQQDANRILDAYTRQIDAPTIGDVLGGANSLVRNRTVLPSGLPYRRVFEGLRYSALPEPVRPQIAFRLNNDIAGTPKQAITYSWAEVNNRKVTLSFSPATADDEAVMESLIPETGVSDPSLLPKAIPAYLIEVVPELRIDEQVVLQGSPVPLGKEVRFTYSVTDPLYGTKHYPNDIVAGSYLAVAIIGGSVAERTLNNTEERLTETVEMLKDTNALPSKYLSRESLLGDFFLAGLLGYFLQYHSLGKLAAQIREAHFGMGNSVGTFGYVPNVTYFFGIPQSLTAGGAVMDLDRVAYMANLDGNDQDAGALFNFRLGMLSSGLEHIVPEQMMVREDTPGMAVSSVRALEQASAKGQRIYHIRPSNKAETLEKISLDKNIKKEIEMALSIGREVIVHAEPIMVPGWQGGGYVVFDPNTGAGAWKIAGGPNGGFLDHYPEDVVSLLLLMAAGLGAVSGASLIPFIALSLGAIAAFNVFMTFLKTDLYLRESNCPRALSNLHLSLSVAFAALPGAWPKYLGGVAMSSFYSFVVGRSVNGAANACKVL